MTDTQKKEYLSKIDAVIAHGKYKDNWESLSQHPTPKWFTDGKFGIFIHWGIYSVPAFGSEWYSRNMYLKDRDEFKHHIETYGPQKSFGYKDFIPMFRGEKFSAEEWISLIEQAGARYVVPVAEHHDGFQMYKSSLSHWNAAEMGPCRDVLGELSETARRHGIVNCASTHRIEHWFFMGHGREFESDISPDKEAWDFYAPAMPEPDRYHLNCQPSPTKEFLDDWMIRTCEIIDKYKIHQIYFDWWIIRSEAKPYLKKIAAYYYNRAEEWGEEVMIAYKHDAFAFGTAVVDMERGKFADVKPFPWQTDTAIGKWSWGYTTTNQFKDSRDIIRDLVDIVSKNGCLLLNIGPKPDGTITDEEKSVLLEIGKWLKINGEAIYGTHIWRTAAEGPTKMREGMFSDNGSYDYTPEDFRFTAKGGSLYATCLCYPSDGKVTIKSLRNGSPLAAIKDVALLGSNRKPTWFRDDEGLHIEAEALQTRNPVVFKIVID